jgi:SAM-dependent methyltransferase
MGGGFSEAMEQYTYGIMYQTEETHWWFVGRRNLILDQVAQFYRNRQNLRLLDIGCGTGIFVKFLDSYGEAFGLDISIDALSFCQKRGFSMLVQGSGLSIPFLDNTFDVLTANDLVEHLEDDVVGLKEFLRVLKPGGRAFIFVPAYQFLWSLQDEISHHKRRYTAKQLKEAIRVSGFELEKITYANTLLFPVIYTGRQVLKVLRRFREVETESDLHPSWSNKLLTGIFNLEVPILRHMKFPFGVSIMAVCKKP